MQRRSQRRSAKACGGNCPPQCSERRRLVHPPPAATMCVRTAYVIRMDGPADPYVSWMQPREAWANEACNHAWCARSMCSCMVQRSPYSKHVTAVCPKVGVTLWVQVRERSGAGSIATSQLRSCHAHVARRGPVRRHTYQDCHRRPSAGARLLAGFTLCSRWPRPSPQRLLRRCGGTPLRGWCARGPSP